MKLLGVWLILTSLSPFVVVTIPGFGMLVGIIGIAAGVAILLGR
jgi:hypothetical protein